jgi:hypothetical protein
MPAEGALCGCRFPRSTTPHQHRLPPPTALRLRAQLMGLGYFIGKHRDEEALGFAPDK